MRMRSKAGFLELPKVDSDSKQIKRLRWWLKFLNLKSEVGCIVEQRSPERAQRPDRMLK